jgi:hypothetical protein
MTEAEIELMKKRIEIQLDEYAEAIKSLSPNRRAQIARKAARTRWSRPRVVEVTSPVERAAITRALTPSQDRCPV